MPLSESQKGRITEHLIGAMLMLQSNGNLRVSVPLVDDEGVDLIIGNRANDKILLLQIKSRFTLQKHDRYRTNVRRATCKPNPKKFLLFVYYDKSKATLGETCWFVCAAEFCELLSNQRTTRPDYIFNSSFESKADMWVPFRLSVKELAKRVQNTLS